MNINHTQLLSNWDIGKTKSIEEVDSFSNEVYLITTKAEEKYILKSQDDSDKINREASLLSNLQKNVPIAYPIKTRINSYYVKENDKYYVLYPFLEGQSFTDHYNNNPIEKAKLLGEVAGKLHYYLKDIESDEVKSMNLKNNVLEWSKEIIKKNQDHFDFEFILTVMNNFKKEMTPVYSELPKQIIHRDLHPGNILFQDKEVTGIVDFELSVEGVRIFDPCYCATSMLVSDIEDKVKRKKWIDLLLTILKGYNKKNNLNDVEIANIINILYSIQLIFMAYSCTIDDHEAAKCNENVLKWLFKNRYLIEEKVALL